MYLIIQIYDSRVSFSEWVSEWVSDCCLTQDKQLSAITWRDQLHSEKWWWYPLCTRTNSFNCIFKVHAYCNNTLLVNMSLHADPFSRSRPNVLIKNVCKAIANFIWFATAGANIRSNTPNANLFHFVKKIARDTTYINVP